MIEVMSKVDMAIEKIDNSDIVKRLRTLKNEMDNDLELTSIISAFNKAKTEYEQDTQSVQNLIAIKKQLYKHPIIVEYHQLYNELSLSFNRFNKQISSMLNIKNSVCHRI